MTEATMTGAQFDALAKLIRSSGGPIEHAARRVLVDQIRPADAARELAVRPDSISNAVRRYKQGLALAQVAAGSSKGKRS